MARDLFVISNRGCLSHLALVTPGCYIVPHLCRSLVCTMLMDGLSGKGSGVQDSDILVRIKQEAFDIFHIFFYYSEKF